MITLLTIGIIITVVIPAILICLYYVFAFVGTIFKEIFK